jgi:hypothetical protein
MRARWWAGPSHTCMPPGAVAGRLPVRGLQEYGHAQRFVMQYLRLGLQGLGSRAFLLHSGRACGIHDVLCMAGHAGSGSLWALPMQAFASDTHQTHNRVSHHTSLHLITPLQG